MLLQWVAYFFNITTRAFLFQGYPTYKYHCPAAFAQAKYLINNIFCISTYIFLLLPDRGGNYSGISENFSRKPFNPHLSSYPKSLHSAV
jgi:hypothetical protein